MLLVFNGSPPSSKREREDREMWVEEEKEKDYYLLTRMRWNREMEGLILYYVTMNYCYSLLLLKSVCVWYIICGLKKKEKEERRRRERERLVLPEWDETGDGRSRIYYIIMNYCYSLLLLKSVCVCVSYVLLLSKYCRIISPCAVFSLYNIVY